MDRTLRSVDVKGREMINATDSPRIETTTTAAVGGAPRPRVLLIGPLPRVGTLIGGTQVSFAQLVQRLRAGASFEVEVIDTSRVVHGGSAPRRVASNLKALTSVLGAILRSGRRTDVVVLNMSSGALLKAGPLVAEFARFARIPLVVRAFGGNLDEVYDRLSGWRRRWVDSTLLRAPLVLLQTHALCERFAHVDSVRWYPTTRACPENYSAAAPRCKRFLFVSQVRAEKGIFVALEAARRLPADIKLTVRGPLLPGFDARVFEQLTNVEYGGPASSVDVPRLLAEHDALVFPSWYEGEGIPGVVIEALQAGRAVITTAWRALPSIVEHQTSGLIVPTHDVDALAYAMERLATDSALHRRLSVGARARGVEFDAARWHRRFEQWLEQVIAREVPSLASLPSSDISVCVEDASHQAPRLALPARVLHPRIERQAP